ncbi:DUF3429 domain-containing protein [Pseudaestuariivita sp.]|uniref:DUF3429 domain-containing protein n=1 Tax=Pseudaestuariivita sp. TaxID=2211669 RepID=UPI004059607D
MPHPRLAFALTWLGMLPFLAATGLALLPEPASPGYLGLLYPSDSFAILAGYGVVIFAFMSGVLWGLAASPSGTEEAPQIAYLLAVLPALAAFFLATTHILGSPSDRASLVWLMLGFPALLLLDALFLRWGLAPAWWLKLRLPPTLVATLACAIGAYI